MPKLYVTGMPIDEDFKRLDPRAFDMIKSCSLLIAEERKNALRLLAAVGERGKEFELLNEHTTDEERVEILNKLLLKDLTVFVSDAGTPCIADPDYKFVNLCINKGVEVLSVPGATSITAALSVSGFNTDRYQFLGFPPKDNQKRKEFFKSLNSIAMTTVFLERPYSLSTTLKELSDFKGLVSVSISIGMESEQTYRGKVKELLSIVPNIKAPFVVVLDIVSK